MISLILPYWKRQAAADKALAMLAALYADTDVEVIVVDDGDPEPFVEPRVDLDLKVLRLQQKATPKSPVTCWNEGVKLARGDVIALSCIEVLHRGPVLPAMEEALGELGPDGYVLAAAWCPEQGAWHTHSSLIVPQCPPGAGLAFLGMLHRELYERAGGFDEAYRDGAGYEDRDFIHRLHRAGAQFAIRDDLVVDHPKTGATIKWPAEAFARNKMIFEEKWIN